MVKHTQTIRRQQPTSSLSVFDYFLGLVLKGLPEKSRKFHMKFIIKQGISYKLRSFVTTWKGRVDTNRKTLNSCWYCSS